MRKKIDWRRKMLMDRAAFVRNQLQMYQKIDQQAKVNSWLESLEKIDAKIQALEKESNAVDAEKET